MKCIKCGKETADSAVFCEECLTDMERHPVKPGTPVILPKRAEQPVQKHGRKKAVKPEQQVVSLRRTVRWLVAAVALLLLIAAASITMLVKAYTDSTYSLPFSEYFVTEDTQPDSGE